VVKIGVYLAVLLMAGLLTVRCATGGSRAIATPGTGAPTATIAEPKQPTAKPGADISGQEVLSEAVRHLDQAQSFQFEVSAVLKSTQDGQPREWSYKGTGASAKPDKIQWTLEGQADVYMRVVASGDKISCTDTRGPNTKDCSLAFGGPRPGSSPFTVLSYLKNFEKVTVMDQQTIGGTSYDHLVFSPSLAKVSAIDPAHSRALSSVSSVRGEVWVDKKTRLPVRERAVVKSPSSSGDEIVDTTIIFSKFNEQVNIEVPGQGRLSQ